jgi:hypothetical protein
MSQLFNRQYRKLENAKESGIRTINHDISKRNILDGEIVISKPKNKQLKLSKKIDGELWNVNFSNDGNQYVDKNLTIKNNLDVSGTSTLGGTLTVNDGAVFNEASADVDFRVESNDNTHMLFVDGGSNEIGIGTSSPDNILEIEKDSGGTAASGPVVSITDANSGGNASAALLLKRSNTGSTDWMITNEAGKLFFDYGINLNAIQDGATTMSLSARNVGIGTEAPTFPLHIVGAGTDTYVAMFDNSGAANTSYGIEIQCGDTDHSDDALTHYITFKESDGGTVGEIDNGAGSGALRINTASDERLKENIKDTEVDGLNIINSLTLREFNWKKRYNKKVEKCGLIAQEVRKVLPSAVTEMSDDDKTLGISEPSFVYTLIKAVQELSASNDALKARIEVLEAS